MSSLSVSVTILDVYHITFDVITGVWFFTLCQWFQTPSLLVTFSPQMARFVVLTVERSNEIVVAALVPWLLEFETLALCETLNSWQNVCECFPLWIVLLETSGWGCNNGIVKTVTWFRYLSECEIMSVGSQSSKPFTQSKTTKTVQPRTPLNCFVSLYPCVTMTIKTINK